jgi:hypothetical protein
MRLSLLHIRPPTIVRIRLRRAGSATGFAERRNEIAQTSF